MTDDLTTKLSFRLNTPVLNALEKCAERDGYEAMAYIQKVLAEYAVASGFMPPDEASQTQLHQEIFAFAVKESRALYKRIPFTEHWTLTVVQHLMNDKKFRAKYEKAIGGDAYAVGLPGKSPLNMYLGWYIKNAINASPKTADGKPVRAQVKNEPIQSYTLLIEPTAAPLAA